MAARKCSCFRFAGACLFVLLLRGVLLVCFRGVFVVVRVHGVTVVGIFHYVCVVLLLLKTCVCV